MKHRAWLCVLFVLLAAPASAALLQSGGFVIDSDEYVPSPPTGEPVLVRSNILVNPGFESGLLTPWTTTNWTVTNLDAASGAYSSEDVGNFWIQQDITPTPVAQVISISMYSKQPAGIAFQAVDLLYSDTTYDEFLVAPGVNWTFIDMTSQLRNVGSLVAIRIWGYSAGSENDLTRVDDVIIDVEGTTPVETTSWGRVKGLYR